MGILITGATSGIGYEFASIYAKNQHNLILVSRNKNKLEDIKLDFEEKYKVNIKIISIDLSIPNASKKLISNLTNTNIDIIINNAGVGEYGKFINNDIEKLISMINLNIITLTETTHHFAKHMAKNGGGKILNVASTAAFQPVPTFAVYAATKAYVLNFSEAISYELQGSGVEVCTLCPGPTKTNFDKNSNATHSKHLTQGTMSSLVVAQAGAKQLENNKMTLVVGLKNRLLAFASTTNPFRKLALIISANIVK
ncbi:3-oxoacyl-[acyl-carrier protein] reductase [hydrothermal vent metagenome]|uniref:3-oxoacyl-[acyl-carrier protein] reductase n=1 Tax=hydrothermal vent metagenome TaxID=652676 RepID=A0A3B1E793_9ZZZZ